MSSQSSFCSLSIAVDILQLVGHVIATAWLLNKSSWQWFHRKMENLKIMRWFFWQNFFPPDSAYKRKMLPFLSLSRFAYITTWYHAHCKDYHALPAVVDRFWIIVMLYWPAHYANLRQRGRPVHWRPRWLHQCNRLKSPRCFPAWHAGLIWDPSSCLPWRYLLAIRCLHLLKL